MSDKIALNIDGRELTARKGQTLLQVARNNNIDIPTLCHSEGVEPYGACRLCIVEVSSGSRRRIVVSCLYPAEQGLKVQTSSPRVVDNRRVLVELLLARCSENKTIRELAARLGVSEPRFRPEYLEKEDCIVCGLCARTCEQVVGASAISMVNRGVTKKPGPPFLESARDCIGCGSCFYVCPTGAIHMKQEGDKRSLPTWGVEFQMKKCSACGAYWATEAELAHIARRVNLPANYFDVCPDCR